jgi:hypothetical protein
MNIQDQQTAIASSEYITSLMREGVQIGTKFALLLADDNVETSALDEMKERLLQISNELEFVSNSLLNHPEPGVQGIGFAAGAGNQSMLMLLDALNHNGEYKLCTGLLLISALMTGPVYKSMKAALETIAGDPKLAQAELKEAVQEHHRVNAEIDRIMKQLMTGGE